MPAPDTRLIPLISEVLINNPGLGANGLHNIVTPLYCDKAGRTNLRRPHFFKYLRIMKENGWVDERGGGKRGKEVELYLTEIGKRQYYQQSFELPNIWNKSKVSRSKGGISQELKALYAIILYFNEGVGYKVYTADAAEHILRSFGVSLSSLIVRSQKSLVKSDSEEISQVIFQSVRDDAIVYQEMFLRSDTHERGTTRYRLLLRGITCEAIIDNRDLKVFEYLKFTSKDIMNAIRSLCGLNVLRPVGSLGPTIENEIIYKVDKSMFDFMFGLRNMSGYDIFDRIVSVMKDVWSWVRPPTESGLGYILYMVIKKRTSSLIMRMIQEKKLPMERA